MVPIIDRPDREMSCRDRLAGGAINILMLNWRDLRHPQAGGAETYVHEIAKRLARDHHVTLVCSKFPGSKGRENIDGVEIVRKGGRFSVYPLAAAMAMAKLARKEVDVIVDDVNGVPFFSPLYSNVPVIVIIHHVVGWPIFRKELPFPLSAIGYLGERSVPLIYGRSKIVVVSPSTRQELVGLGLPGGNIDVLVNGRDIRQAPCRGKSPIPTIAYLGRLKDYKRVDHLIKALEIAVRKIPELVLVIAGKGNGSAVEKAVRDRGVQDHVQVVGEVSEADKSALLSSAWLFVTASMKEGWGLSVIEANSCGTPAVSYDVPGLRDSIRPNFNGVLVEDGNIERFAEEIARLIADPDERERMSENAVKWSKQFNWDRTARMFEDILREQVGEAGRGKGPRRPRGPGGRADPGTAVFSGK